MKKLILGLVAIFSMSLAVAQPNPVGETGNIQGVSFVGVNVAGNTADFLQKIEAKGFQRVENNGNAYELKGTFNNQVADILVLSTKTEQVYAVVVLLPKYNNWNTLKTDFKKLKKSFVEQYGKPDKNSHYFSMPFDDIQDEMQKIELGWCYYSCSWNNPKVSIEITKSARIMIIYENDASFQLYAGL